MELDEYLMYLEQHLSDQPRAFPLYSNDVEVFDFRPGRYQTEAGLPDESEWRRVERLFQNLLQDSRFRLIAPGEVLELASRPGASNRLKLESAAQPVPVKKQGKYNITRWAVTGRNDLAVNTGCWRLYEALQDDPGATDQAWQELCYLWSSDFRTHITAQRWARYLNRLNSFQRRLGVDKKVRTKIRADKWSKPVPGQSTGPRLERRSRWLEIENDCIDLRLNCRRGLAIESLRFKGVCRQPLIVTLPHGLYEDISLGADFYSGHLVMEMPGHPKVTDLNPVEPMTFQSEEENQRVEVRAEVQTLLGPIAKRVAVWGDCARLELEYRLDWPEIPLGSLRAGFVALNPAAFDRNSLFFSTHNGGFDPELFYLDGQKIEHGEAVSFLVSAQQALGVTDGVMEIGDRLKKIHLEVDKETSAVIGMMTYRQTGQTFFGRLSFSLIEMDETSHPMILTPDSKPGLKMAITAVS
jgi:hypothetical protein